MLKQSLQQKLGLKINPLQIQLIKLLELPTYQLEQRIKEELEQNPLLEEGEDRSEAGTVEEIGGEDSQEDMHEFGEENDEEEGRFREDDFSLVFLLQILQRMMIAGILYFRKGLLSGRV